MNGFESKGLWEGRRQKLIIFPSSSLLICGRVLITTYLDQISISFQIGFDFLEHTRIIIMENNNRTIDMEVLVCKTKYSLHINIYMSIPEGDISRVFGHKRNQ